jgi:hypothetical protein
MTDKHEKQPNQELSPDLQAFEAQLSSLQPTTGRLERDRLMFEAGEATAESKQTNPPPSAARWIWPTVSTVMTAAAALLLVALVWNPGSVATKSPTEVGEESPNQEIGETTRPIRPSVPESTSDQDEQGHDAPRRVLASLMMGSDNARDQSSASSYLNQRDVLLALGGDRLPEINTTPSAKGGRSNTRVSYMDLLDELTLESYGFAPSVRKSDDLKP